MPVPLLAAAAPYVVPAVATIIAGILNNHATGETNEQNLEIYREESAYNRAAAKRAERLAAKNLALNARAQAFSEAEAGRNRGERAEERGYSRILGSYQRGADLLAQSLNLSQAKAAPFQKYAAVR